MTNRFSRPPLYRYSAARRVFWAAVAVVFPPRCCSCGRAGQAFCADCRASLAYLPAPFCERCGYPVPTGTGRWCPTCGSAERLAAATPSPLLGIRSAAFFEGALRQALHSLKYKHDIILADDLARLLQARWRSWGLPGEVVMPVPLSAQRQRERGYNQAALLAEGFATLAGLACAPGGAARVRHTLSQVGLSAAQRRENVAGAFQGAARWVAGRTVILIDDVCTTGATLTACADALRAAGAAGVWGLTVARARADWHAAEHTVATSLETR